MTLDNTTNEAGTLAFHRYGGRADLPALLDFASEATARRAPLRAAWHPGDVIWRLKAQFDAKQPIWLARGGDRVRAVIGFDGPSELLVEALPGDEPAIDAALAWVEARVGTGPSALAKLSVTAFDADRERHATLLARGFQREGPAGVQFIRDLTDPPDTPSPPPGHILRDCVGIDLEARAQAHRDAWNALDHIGLAKARSSFTAEIYRSLSAAPGYDPALDIVLQAPDGRLVANCIAWSDPLSGVGMFEPVGVHPEFRGRGFAGLVITEGLLRLHVAGLATARIGTAHFNAPAIAAYARAGFTLADRSSTWVKPLDRGPKARKPDGL